MEFIVSASALEGSSNPNDVYKHLIEVGGNHYINLVNTGPDDNFSMYKVPANKPWGSGDSDVKTVWSKLRFDPSTLKINTGDFTYSTSTGICHHSQYNQDRIPFGTAFDCEYQYSQTGRARIDLRGTNFAVDDSFATGGWTHNGSVKVTENNQVVDLTGGGHCGWIAPKAANDVGEDECHKGGWTIRLKVLKTCDFKVSNRCFVKYTNTPALAPNMKFLIANQKLLVYPYSGNPSIDYKALLNRGSQDINTGGYKLTPKGFVYNSQTLASNALVPEEAMVMVLDASLGNNKYHFKFENGDNLRWDGKGGCSNVYNDGVAQVFHQSDNIFHLRPCGCGACGYRLYMAQDWPSIKADYDGRPSNIYDFALYIEK